jgi:hypothetical protein
MDEVTRDICDDIEPASTKKKKKEELILKVGRDNKTAAHGPPPDD